MISRQHFPPWNAQEVLNNFPAYDFDWFKARHGEMGQDFQKCQKSKTTTNSKCSEMPLKSSYLLPWYTSHM